MTPVEKGKFCSSCQKTVIDFSMMSDREIAAFLKKPATSTCGRFKADQLERELLIPKKRIPWLRYFFQFTWPAMVMFLKSCGSRYEVTGDYTIGKKETIQYPADEDLRELMVGGITSDTIRAEPKKLPKKHHKSRASHSIEHEALVKKDPMKLIDEFTVEQKQPVDVSRLLQGGYMGGLMIRVVSHSIAAAKEDSLEQQVKEAQDQETVIYPNPARAGHSVVISRPKGKFQAGQVHLLSSSAQLIQSFQHQSDQPSLEIPLPSALKPGLYFLQIIERGSSASTTKKLIVQ
jgi:hypothetical protein